MSPATRCPKLQVTEQLEDAVKRVIWVLVALVTLSLLPLGALSEDEGQVIHIDAVVRSYGAQGKSRWLTYGFSPNIIEVARGQKVTLELTSQNGTHSLAIPGLGVRLDPVRRGETARATFVANEPGSYEMVCQAACDGDDRKMAGRFIVRE